MRLIWPIIKDTAVYLWEELFYLIIFNLVTVIVLAPGFYLVWSGPSLEPPLSPMIYVPLGIILMSALPYAIFGFFWAVYEISEGKAIKISTFFSGGRQMIKHAYIWWGINVVVVVIISANIAFYTSFEATWSTYVSMLFFGILLAWGLTQAFALTMYPRLIEPGFKMATRNAMVVVAKQPLPVLLAGFLSLAFAVAGIIIIPVGWFIAVAVIATLLNMTTRKILRDLLPPEEEEEDVGFNIELDEDKDD